MKNKAITILIISFLAILAIIFFLIRPVATSIWNSWKELKGSETDLKTANDKKQILEALQNNPDLNRINEIAIKYIPQEPQSGELVIELTAIASINNIKIEEISMQKTQTTTTSTQDETATPTPKGKQTSTPSASGAPALVTKEIPFQIGIAGAYSNITSFLRGIETSARLITIEDLVLHTSSNSIDSSTSTAQTENLLSVQLTGKAYYRENISLEKNLANLEVSSETIDFFSNLKSWGLPINLPQESGFGRNNPFETY